MARIDIDKRYFVIAPKPNGEGVIWTVIDRTELLTGLFTHLQQDPKWKDIPLDFISIYELNEVTGAPAVPVVPEVIGNKWAERTKKNSSPNPLR